jgi:hypothetical protein
MAEILVLDVCARRLSAAGDLLFVGIDMTRRRVGAPFCISACFPCFCVLFFPLAFSFAISMTFPVFAAPRRPVNRLYFFTTGFSRARRRETGFDRNSKWTAPLL